MPTVSVYIRMGDVKKWGEVKNKAQLIHDALNKGVWDKKDDGWDIPPTINDYRRTSPNIKVIENDVQIPIIKTPKQAQKAVGGYGDETGYISKSFSSRKKK